MNDILINADVKETACRLLQIAENPAQAAQALAEACEEYADCVGNFPHAGDFWRKVAKGFGSAQLTIFVAQKEFKKLTK